MQDKIKDAAGKLMLHECTEYYMRINEACERLRYYIKKKECLKALIEKRFYNPHDVFNHAPEFYKCEVDERYAYKIHIVKWNTRSTRMTVLWARFNEKKNKWVFSRKPGLGRIPHGERMRSGR
jgi:hypothetical protein